MSKMVSLNLLPLFLCCFTWSACKCASLQTVVSGRSGETSCVGDTVTYTCNISASSHSWMISALQNDIILIFGARPFIAPPYTAQVVADDSVGMVTKSTLTVTPSSLELNGINITCVGGGENQETTVMVFGPPSAPRLMVAAGADLRFYIFNITPPEPSECVVNYTITAPGVDDMTFMPNQVAAGPITSPSTFDLCANTYNFTVTAFTASNRSTSLIVSLDPGNIDFSEASATDLRRDMSIGGIIWATNVPSSCFSGYVISLTNNPAVNFTVDDTRISFQTLIEGGFTPCMNHSITVTPTPLEMFSEPLDIGSNSIVVFINDPAQCPGATMATTETTTETTTEITIGDTGSNIAPAVGGAVGGVVAVLAAIFVMLVIIVCVVKKKGRSDKDDDIKVISKSSKEPYHSSGAPPPQTSIALSDAGTAGAMYASPDEIKHEAAGPTGDEYALVTSNTKKKSRQPAPAADTPDVGDMYSVPDKTKKKENQGLVYADIGHQPAPKKGRVVPQQPDNEPVTYATVAV